MLRIHLFMCVPARVHILALKCNVFDIESFPYSNYPTILVAVAYSFEMTCIHTMTISRDVFTFL